MEIGVGLPNAVPDTTGKQLTDWAQTADEAGFSCLGTIDRLVYPNYEPMVALSAAAAVTERIKLATTVMLGPVRRNGAMIAKQALSLDALAGGGRAVIGISVGAREDDFEITGVRMSERAALLEAELVEIRRIWNGEGENEAKVGPRPQGGGPRLIVGGHVDAAFERAAKHGDGWIMGGGSPETFAGMAPKVRDAWSSNGRDGEPHTMSLAYFSLGPDAEQNAQRYVGDYYAFLGEEMSGMIAAGTAKDADAVQSYLSAFEQAGCDELVWIPCSSDPGQVGLLAEAAGLT
jgi:alkanesulfonate monooxygenase SsuD/methylene tetrahydromethanopterin reductase-like flavin-dependent oxidoreductase (luciferase family)